jgi:hypothetical protein
MSDSPPDWIYAFQILCIAADAKCQALSGYIRMAVVLINACSIPMFKSLLNARNNPASFKPGSAVVAHMPLEPDSYGIRAWSVN